LPRPRLQKRHQSQQLRQAAMVTRAVLRQVDTAHLHPGTANNKKILIGAAKTDYELRQHEQKNTTLKEYQASIA